MYRAVRQSNNQRQFPLSPIGPVPVSAEMAKKLASLERKPGEEKLLLLCKERELAENGMKEIVLGTGARLLLVRKGEDFFALQPNCPNCACPLIQGVLCKSQIRCPTHGSAYNLRTGLLEDGVGLNSIWTFKVQLTGAFLYANVPQQKLASLRLGPEPLSRSPSAHSVPIVVVGAGIAGLTCVETLRQLGYAGRILLISRENELPYDRKSLSKQFCLSADDKRPLRSREFLEGKLGIGLWLGQVVKAIRPEERRVMVEGANGAGPKAVEYSELVLALGAANRRLQGVKEADLLEGVLYLRTLEDACQLAKEVKGRNVAVIGSGFLGFEVASLVASEASNVAIYGKAQTPLTILGTEVGNEIRKFMQDKGISIRQDSVLRSMAGFDRVHQLTFRDGLTANADTVIVCIGVMPSTSILMGSGIRTNPEGFVLVDERMQTNVPNVFACGDCVNFALPSNGASQQQRRASMPHWQIGQNQGRQAAYSILGISAQPRFVPFLWIRLFDRLISFSGDPTLEADERIVRGSIAGNDFVVYFLKAERVIGVANCGPRNVAIQFIELFRRGRAVTRAEVKKNERDEWRHLLGE